jgi:putative cell wall-binding protein
VHSPHRRRRVPLAATLAALLVAGLVPVALAHPIAHGGPPRVRNLRPAFGEVTATGPMTVAAQVVADVAVSSHTLRLDGVVVPSRREGDASHPTIAADVLVGPGDHVAQLDVVGTDGRTGGRAWRFTASDLAVRRIAGADRIETAVAISKDQFTAPGVARVAVLARADDFADALAGSALAGAKNGPVLLTSRTSLSPATRAELTRALVPGSTVYLLGGTTALSQQVATDVTAAGFAPMRLAGATRAETAVEVADEIGGAGDRTVFVVNGFSFPDALSASSHAAANGWPILLAERDRLPSETSAWMRANDVATAFVVGGTAAVSPATLDAVSQAAGTTATRIAGADRYATSIAAAERFRDPGAPVVAASGRAFPDALAGGPRAAALGGPLVLVPGGAPADPDAFGRLDPANVVVLGGTSALPESVASGVRAAVLDVGGPVVVASDPAPGIEIDAMDPITIEFDRDVDLANANVYVTMAGEEVPGALAAGDFPDTLVFTPIEVPVKPPLGQAVDVHVVALGNAGGKWRHVDQHVVYRKLDMARGDSGPAVTDLQQRLTQLGYWLGTADGQFGVLTSQAVMAFQKVHGLARSGAVDAATRAALANPRPFAPRTGGDHVEIDKARQVLVVVRGGQPLFVFNTSTGTEKPYEHEGTTYVADTPTGTFTVFREIDGVRESHLGTLYRPKYFTSDGIAIHGSASVPSYPSSHGCVRLTNAATDFVWANNLIPIGTKVTIY